MEIPRYPEFKAVELEDKPHFDHAWQLWPPVISEYTFTNIYAWAKAYDFGVSRIEDFILLRCDQKYAVKKAGSSSARVFFPPIGPSDTSRLINRVLKEIRGSFVRVPEEAAFFLASNPEVTVTPDEDNADYLYLASDLINLAGAKFDGKRNLLRKFKSSYAYEYVPLDENNAKEALASLKGWCLIKGCDAVESLNNERNAIVEMARHFSLFDLRGAGIRVMGELRAFIFAQKLNADTLVVHVLKADAQITGLYQALLNEFLIRQPPDFTYVNLEQDMGLEGLRKAKLSYHPVSMVKKFTITLK